MAINTKDEARQVVDLIRAGKLTGERKDKAMAALKDWQRRDDMDELTLSQRSALERAGPAANVMRRGMKMSGEQRRSNLINSPAAGVSNFGVGITRGILDIGQNLAALGGMASEAVGGSGETAQAVQDTLAQWEKSIADRGKRTTEILLGPEGTPEEIERISNLSQSAGQLVTPLKGAQLLSKGVAQVIPSGLTAAGKVDKALLPAIRTGALTAAASTLEGVVGTALLSPSDKEGDERREEILANGTMGGLISGAISVPMGFWHTGKNAVARVINRELAEGNLDEAAKMTEQFGTPLAAAQSFRSESARVIAAQSAGTRAQKFMKAQGERLSDDFSRALGTRVTGSTKDLAVDPGQSLVRAEKLAKEWKKSRNKAANAAFEKQINKAIAHAGDKPIGMLPTARERVQQIRGDLAQMGLNKSKFLTPQAKRVFDLIENPGGMTARDIADVNALVNKMASGKVRILKKKIDGDLTNVWGAKLAEDVTASITDELTPFLAGTKAQQAVRMIQTAGRQFRQTQDEVRAFNDQVIGVFKTANPGQAAQHFGGLSVVQQRAVARWLDDMGAEGQILKNDIISDWHDAAQHAGWHAARTSPGKISEFDVEAYGKALADMSSRSRIAGLISPEQERRAVQGIRLIKEIMNSPVGKNVQRIPSANAGDIAINVAMRTAGFTSRLLANAVARGKGIEWYLWSPEGAKQLQALVKGGNLSSADLQRRLVASIILTDMINSGDEGFPGGLQ